MADSIPISNLKQENQDCIIWDIGNVLYPYSRVTQEYYALCREAHVEIALEIFPMLSREEARYLVDDCYETYHDCYGAFIPVIIHYGLDLEETRLRLFVKHYAILYELLVKHCPDVFSDTTDLIDAFRGTSGRYKHGVLSQCCMESFGMPTLDKLGIMHFFEPKAILGLDQVGFVKKAESTEPLRIALELLEADPEHTYFVEDLLPNLERASEIEGLRCIYINHGEPLDKLPSYVSNQFREPADFLRSLKNNQISAELQTTQCDVRENPVAMQSWRKYLMVLSGVILAGALGARLGYYQANKRVDKLMMGLLYDQSATNLQTSVKLLEKFRSGQVEEGEETLEKLIDVELSTLALYEKVPSKDRSPKIIDYIRAAKEYRKNFTQHKVNPDLANSVQKALDLAK